jgi:hypothetical protein
VNLIQRNMKDLHTSFHCEQSDSKESERSVMRSKKEVVWLWGPPFPLDLRCFRGEESTENCEVSLNLSIII